MLHTFVRNSGFRAQSTVLPAGIRSAALAIALVVLLFCPAHLHADDIYFVTISNATFTATCIGGGTCTEVINAHGYYDPTTGTASNVTGSMTGTLNVTFNVYGTPTCTAPGCISGPSLYDPNAKPGFNPIEFQPDISMFNAPNPTPLLTGPTGAELFVAGGCGGDQPACNTPGAFPGNGATDYFLVSGTYTSVDLGPIPEPASFVLLSTGAGVLGLRLRRR